MKMIMKNRSKINTNECGVSFRNRKSKMNFSNINFPEDRIWIHIPNWEITVKVLAFIPVIIFGLYGNFVILQLIVLNRALRTPTNILVANMAVADILTLLICPIMFLINDFYQNYEMGRFGCKTEGFLDVSFLITAVFNLSAISYDRLTAIVLPTETRLTMRGVKFVIALTWFGGFLFAMPLAMYRSYKVRLWKNFTETYCKENSGFLPKYWYVLMAVMVWLPLSVMVVCYTAIFIKLDRYEKRVLNREHPLSVSYKKTVAKMVFIVLIAFIALRFPFTIVVLIRDRYITNSDSLYENGFTIIWYIAQCLMFLNAAINPLIYGFNNDNFKRAYDQTPLCSCFKRKSDKIEYKKIYYCIKCQRFSTKWFKLICCCFCLRAKNDFSISGEQRVSGAEVARSPTIISVDQQLTKETNLDEIQTKYKLFDNQECHNNNNIISEDFI